MITIDHMQLRYRPGSPVGPWTYLQFPFGQTTIQLEGFERNVIYEFEARSVAVNGACSQWIQQTHIISGATMDAITPGNAIVNLNADGEVGQIAVSWNASGYAASTTFEVSRALSDPNSGGTYAVIDSGITSTTVVETSVPAGQTRWYRVRATDAGVVSNYYGPVYAAALADYSEPTADPTRQ